MAGRCIVGAGPCACPILLSATPRRSLRLCGVPRSALPQCPRCLCGEIHPTRGRDAPSAMYRGLKCQAGGQGSAWPLIARNLLFDPLRAVSRRSRYQFRKSGADQSTVRGGPQAEHGPDPAVISTPVNAQAVCRPPALIGSSLCSPFCVGKQQHSLLFFSLSGVLGPGSGPTLCLQPSTPQHHR